MPIKERSKFYGLNYAAPRYAGGENGKIGFLQAQEITNIKLLEDGFANRKGRIKVGDTDFLCHSLGWFTDYAAVEYLVMGISNSIYVDQGAAGTPASSYSGFSVSSKLSMASYNENLFVCNGTDTNLKFNGTSWTRLGLVAPAAAPGVAVNVAAGNLNGTYIYQYVYLSVDPLTGYEVESKASSPSAEVSPANQKVNVTVVWSTDTQVTGIRIYRFSDVAAVWQKVADTTNTNHVYTDNIADANLGAEINYMLEGEPLDSSGSAVVFDWITEWKGALWAAAGRVIYHTRQGYPEKWFNYESELIQPFYIDSNPDERAVGAIGYKNMLVIFTENNMCLITGNQDPYTLIEYKTGIGCIARATIRDCSGYLVWLSKEGVYMWDGANDPVQVSDLIDGDASGESRGITDANIDSLRDNAFAIYNKPEKEYWLSVPYGNENECSRVFVLDFSVLRGAESVSPWSRHDIAIAAGIEAPDNNVYTADSYEKKYFKEFTGTEDYLDGIGNAATDIIGNYKTRVTDFGDRKMSKKLMFLSASGYTTSEPIQVKTEIDGGTYTDEDFTISGGGAEWADPDVKWGTDDVWGGALVVSRTLSYPQEYIGKTLAFEIIMKNLSRFDGFEVDYRLTRGYES